MATEWFVLIGQEEKGPFSGSKLKELAAAGKLQRSMSVRKADDDDWVEAGRIKGLFDPEEFEGEGAGESAGPHFVPPPIPRLGGPRYYESTGAIPPFGLIGLPIVGVAVTAVLALVYAALDFYNPFIYITFLATLGLAFGVGFAVNKTARATKIRNNSYRKIVGLGCSFLTVYAMWAWFLLLYFDDHPIILNPLEILDASAQIATTGWWSLIRSAGMVSGWFLKAIWLVEAGVIFVVTFSASAVGGDPYCEDCDCWTTELEDVAHLPLMDPEELKLDLEAERYEVLFEQDDSTLDSDDCLVVNVFACVNCEESNYLTVKHDETTYDKDGDPSVNSTELIEHVRVPKELFEVLTRGG